MRVPDGVIMPMLLSASLLGTMLTAGEVVRGVYWPRIPPIAICLVQLFGRGGSIGRPFIDG